MSDTDRKTEDEMIADNGRDLLAEATEPASNVDEQLAQIEEARAEADDSEIIFGRMPDGRLWPDLVACPACGETTAIADEYQDRRYPGPRCGNCGKVFSGPYRKRLVEEATAKAADQEAKPMTRDDLYAAAKRGFSADWVGALVSSHALGETELLAVCELVAHMADQGFRATDVIAHLRDKLDALARFRRRNLPTGHRGLTWDDATQLAIPLHVGDYVKIDGEMWNIKSLNKTVELNQWDRLDIEAVRPYREGINLA